jgi:amino acid permease
MMALAGIIGPGLLVGSGGALSSGGPAALLIGFGTIGILAFSIMQSLGELTTLYPSGGAFTALADRFVDKAFGVAVGWNYFIICKRFRLPVVTVLSSGGLQQAQEGLSSVKASDPTSLTPRVSQT